MLSWTSLVFLLSHLSSPCLLQGLVPADNASGNHSLVSGNHSLVSGNNSLVSGNHSLVSGDCNVSMPPPWPGEGLTLPLRCNHGDTRGDTDHTTALSPQSTPFPETEVNLDLAATRSNSKPFPQRSDTTFREDGRSFVPVTEVPLSTAELALLNKTKDDKHKWNPYVWNKTMQSAVEFLLAFCPKHCTANDVVGGHDTNHTNVDEELNPKFNGKKDQAISFTAECFPCECKNSGNDALTEKPLSIYPDRTPKESNQFCGMGNCCPTGKEVGDAGFAKAGEHAGCLAQRVMTAYVIMGCPADTVNQSLRDACEYGQGEFTVDEPVTDRDTNVTYRNQDCARCHGVRSFQPWSLAVSCDLFQYLYHVMTELELLRLIRGNRHGGTTSVCNVLHEPPPDVPVVDCTDSDFNPRRSKDTVLTSPQHDVMTEGTIIAACNVTGLWADFDADVQAGCGDFTGLSFRVVVDGRPPRQIYTNLFCAVCNGFQPEWRYYDGNKINLEYPVPLTFLLGLKDREEDTLHAGHKTCFDRQWFAFDNECRNVSCPAGKSLNETSSTCTTAVKVIRGLVYQLDIILVPEQILRMTFPIADESGVESMLNKTLVQTFDDKTSGLLVQYDVVFWLYVTYVINVSAPGVFVLQLDVERMNVTASMTSAGTKERDEVEEALVSNLLLQDWTLFLEMTGQTVNFTPSSVHHHLFGIRYHFSNTKAYRHEHSDILDSQYAPIQPQYKIQLTRLLTCPSVEFGPTEFLINPEEGAEDHVKTTPSRKRDPDTSTTSLPSVIKEEKPAHPGELKTVAGRWTVALMKREVSLLHAQFSWEIGQHGGFVVCVDTLEELKARHRRRKAGAFLWQYALSMTAIPLSILCLLVLLVVYALLPELRTQPGLNTMGTCTTLLLAQLSLLLASHRVVSGAWCTALGVLVHLSWLSTFCWTSVCSVHMYRAFSCKTDRRCGRVSYKVLAQSGAVTLLLPVAVVAVVVAVSWQQSGGVSLGYSSTTCYLRSPLVVGLSVLLPLCVILAFNLPFYSLTVYRIHKVTTLQARAQSETESGAQHVRACLRLSLLTGVTWLFSILSESLDLDWLRAVSILANGGQGVLLLLSYVITKRVTDMLMARMGCRDDVIRGSSTRTMELPE